MRPTQGGDLVTQRCCAFAQSPRVDYSHLAARQVHWGLFSIQHLSQRFVIGIWQRRGGGLFRLGGICQIGFPFTVNLREKFLISFCDLI